MKNKRDIEKRFYECIGIKKFRNAAFMLAKSFMFPLLFVMGMNKEERNEVYHNPSNYSMKTGHGAQDLKDFIPWLFVNGGIHTFFSGLCALSLFTASSVGVAIANGIALGINLYCIFLQRYNYIRIKETLEKYELRDQKRRVRIVNELGEKKQYWRKYKDHFPTLSEKEDSYDKFLENASLEELRKYKNYITVLEEIEKAPMPLNMENKEARKVFKKEL